MLQTSDYDVNWPIFRYAEVLLIYAEASNEINGPNQLAINALNLLRSRARNTNAGGIHRDILPRSLTLQRSTGLVDLTLSNPLVSNPSAFRDYIILERSRELSQEGKRWFDLVRWGKLKSTLSGLIAKMILKSNETLPKWYWPFDTPSVSDELHKIEAMSEPIPLRKNGSVNPNAFKNYWNGNSGQTVEWNSIIANLDEKKHNLFPIPNSEILANPLIGANNPEY